METERGYGLLKEDTPAALAGSLDFHSTHTLMEKVHLTPKEGLGSPKKAESNARVQMQLVDFGDDFRKLWRQGSWEGEGYKVFAVNPVDTQS